MSQHVLIVEDDSSSRHALELLLNDCGYQTCAVASAEDALSWIDDGHIPAAVLVDVDLPRGNGLELLDHLRGINPSLRSVVFSASDREEIASDCRRRSAECVQKPVRFPELLRLLDGLQGRPN